MSDRTCSIDGCERRHVGRGWCGMHLARVKKYGDPGPAERQIALPSHTPLERFQRYGYDVTPDGCWRWRGKLDPHTGYGSINTGGRISENAHRLSYRLFVGPIAPGLHVCHRCDNRACVNPDHLFLGTHQDNMADMVAKGRSNANERNPMAKVTDDQVREIRAARARGVPGIELARQYGIARNHVYALANGYFRPLAG